jgi:hypothetical protein
MGGFGSGRQGSGRATVDLRYYRVIAAWGVGSPRGLRSYETHRALRRVYMTVRKKPGIKCAVAEEFSHP